MIVQEEINELQKKTWTLYLKHGRLSEPLIMRSLKVNFQKARDLKLWTYSERHKIATEEMKQYENSQ
jgi:hypothetical protein